MLYDIRGVSIVSEVFILPNIYFIDESFLTGVICYV
ncbi:Uncharacterised protein [Niallia circulans]|nr:Uncharacterised protein [Niallia circulans]